MAASGRAVRPFRASWVSGLKKADTALNPVCRTLAGDIARTGIAVTAMPGPGGGTQEMVSLPLKFIPGWLFGVSANRVREELRDKVLRYQRDCDDVLAEAFQEGRLMMDGRFNELLAEADLEIVQAYQIARRRAPGASQILLEAPLPGRLEDHEQRLENLETTLGLPGRNISSAQAMTSSQAVKALALEPRKTTGRSESGAVRGEFFRRFRIPAYRELPAGRFHEALAFLREWYASVADAPPFQRGGRQRFALAPTLVPA